MAVEPDPNVHLDYQPQQAVDFPTFSTRG
jgi:hypothetical protein